MSRDIQTVRRFARAVTRDVGALDEDFLGRGRPLGVARVLNAIGHGMGDVAQVRAFLDLDSGLMSRLLRRLEDEGLITLTPDPDDKRHRIAALTPAGRAEFDAYEALSDVRAAQILTRVRRPAAVLDAMALVTAALGADRVQIGAVPDQDPRALAYQDRFIAEIQSRHPTGYDIESASAPTLTGLAAPNGALLIATLDGAILGGVGLKRRDATTGEIKRLWIDPCTRGLGLGRRLMERCEQIARDQAMTRLLLDTNSVLHEATAMYRATGWHEVDRFNDDPNPDLFFAKDL